MTTAGAGEACMDGAAMAGTILSGATAGTTHTTVGDGAGTTLGDITVGAGPATMAGVTHMAAGDMQAIMVGVDIMATGTDLIITTIVETMPIWPAEGDITTIMLQVPLYLEGLTWFPEPIADVPMQIGMRWQVGLREAIITEPLPEGP